jgi:flagellar hook-associated protein 3 FlgL
MIRESILRNVSSAMERLQFAQTQLATGKRVFNPSDDAVGVARAIRVRAVLGDNEQFQRNIKDALGWIDNTEPAVDAMVSIIMEVKDLAIRGASDTETSYEREVLAGQVDGLIEQLVGLANTRYGNRFIFAGTHTLTVPYSLSHDVTGETVDLADMEWVELDNARLESGSAIVTGPAGELYVEGLDYEIDYSQGRIRMLPGGSMTPGSTYTVDYQTQTISRVELEVPDTTGALNREVAPGVHERINVGGQEIFDSGIDVFSLMVRVKNSLFRNDGAAVNQALDEIETALDQVTAALGEIGIRRNTFEVAATRLESEEVNLRALISGLEDADVAEVMVRFEAEQMAYESALAAAAEIMNTSLINFIT